MVFEDAAGTTKSGVERATRRAPGGEKGHKLSRDRSQVDLLENKREDRARGGEGSPPSDGGVGEGGWARDLDFLYYQFMPLHGAADIFKPRREKASHCVGLFVVLSALLLLSLSSNVPLPPTSSRIPPFRLSFTPPCLLGLVSLPWKRGGSHTFVNRRPSSQEEVKGRRRRRGGRVDGDGCWTRKRWKKGTGTGTGTGEGTRSLL